MGLTVQYKSTIPAGWSWDYAVKQLRRLHEFASTLPVIDTGEIHCFEGNETDYDKYDDANRWRCIQAKRYVDNPWKPGTTGSDHPKRSAMIDVHVADGCEPFIFGVSEFEDHVWEPTELVVSEKTNRAPFLPSWAMCLDNKSSFHKYNKESTKIIKDFMKRFKLRKTRRKSWSYHSGHSSSTPSFVSQHWHKIQTADRWERTLVEVGEARTKYLSHRKGWDDTVAVITFVDPERCGYYGNENSLVLEFTCSVDEAREIVNSRSFKIALKALVAGKRHVNKGYRGWTGFCKTHYAVQSEYGGLDNFIKAHLSVCAMLEHASELGFIVTVDDEGEFWKTHDLDILAREINEQNAFVSAFAGMLKDAIGNTDYGVEAEAFNTSDFERNEMLGHQSEKTAAFLRAISGVTTEAVTAACKVAESPGDSQ